MLNQIETTTSNIASVTVGSNDSVYAAPASNAGKNFVATYARIEQLALDREVWEQGVMRTCNDQLYALLAKCYTLYFEMCGKTDEAKDLRLALDDFISIKGYSFLSKTHTLTKIVKCVFGVDRRRVSTYSLVLREALFQKIPVDSVAAFIANKGGVEEIRRSKSATAKTAKQKAELGKLAVSSNQLAVVSSDKISESLDLADVGKDLIAIVTQQADGSLIVRKLIHSPSVLNAARACAYTSNKAEVTKDVENKKPANDDKVRDDLIKDAA